MANSIEVLVPDIGGFADVSVIDVLVKEGQDVDKETPLITLETEKAAMDVPAPAAGRIKQLKIKQGDKVSEGSLILVLETVAAEGSAAAPQDASPKVQAAPAVAETKAAAPTAEAPSKTGAPAGKLEVTVPDIGGFKDVSVIDVLVKEGQQIDKEAPLITLETEKAAMDVPAPAAGRIVSLKLKQGDKVSEGSLILVLETLAAETVPEAPPAKSPKTETAKVETPKSESKGPAPAAKPASVAAKSAPVATVSVNEATFSKAYASPSVRKFARELGADLGSMNGTGAKGRITHEDVKAWVKSVLSSPAAAVPAAGGGGLPSVPVVDFAHFGPIEVKPLSRIQKISGARLQASWLNLPHVTQNEDADITDLEEARKGLKAEAEKEGVKLTPLVFIIKACILALKEFPRFNTSLDASGQNLVHKQYYNIGFAADTPNGLMVPVIPNADRLSIYETARALAELSGKARAGKLSAKEMQGGTFTISSLGGIGGTSFTPIINAPEVGILGVSRSSLRPVYLHGAFIPRLILPLSLSYDHRVIDGAEAARFAVFLSKTLADAKALT